MAGSSSERAIRDAVAAYARTYIPNSRIIHELVVGGRRADLAAVTPDRVTLFEIKSEKDTLDRLHGQMKVFREAAHAAVLVAHRDYFEVRESRYDGKYLVFAPQHEYPYIDHVWCHPEPSFSVPYGHGKWRVPGTSLAQPAPRRILDLLWKDEQLYEARRQRLDVTTRMNMSQIISVMAYHMTGREIAEAVCRQLRARSFPEADAAIPLDAPAPPAPPAPAVLL